MFSNKYKNLVFKSILKEAVSPNESKIALTDFYATMFYGSNDLVPMNNEDIFVKETNNSSICFYVYKGANDDNSSKFNRYELSKNSTGSISFYANKNEVINFTLETFKENHPDFKTIRINDITSYCKEAPFNVLNISESILDDSVYQNIYEKRNPNAKVAVNTSEDNQAYTERMSKILTKKGLLFTPQNIIGDENKRSIANTKKKAEQTLQQYLNNISNTSEEIKNNILNISIVDMCNTTIENAASGNSSTPVSVRPVKDIILDKGQLNNLNTDYKNLLSNVELSPEVNNTIIKALGVYPAEITSPLVFLNMDKNIQWGHEGSRTSKEILNALFGNDDVFKNGLISYPQGSEELVDSAVYVKSPTSDDYFEIKLSTKGGKNGIGAQASMVSLFKMIIDRKKLQGKNSKGVVTELRYKFSKELSSITTSNDPSGFINGFVEANCSNYGKEVYKTFPAQMALILLFGGTSPARHLSIINTFMKYDINGIHFDYKGVIPKNQANKKETFHNVRNSFCEFINNKFNVTTFIMLLLNSQKYDFAQVNVKPTFNEVSPSITYQYMIQYPAHFDGNVVLEPRGNGIGFHIL